MGWVNLGQDHETAAFAVGFQCVESWRDKPLASDMAAVRLRWEAIASHFRCGIAALLDVTRRRVEAEAWSGFNLRAHIRRPTASNAEAEK